MKAGTVRRVWVSVMAACLPWLAGCAGTGGAAPVTGDAFGRTYYIDGAGNWGYGVLEIMEGLRRAGYRGQVVNWRWSPTFNPALDQTLGRPFARSRGKELGEDINAYCTRYPDNQVNIIGLSAGTGVAIWACEALKPPAHVHNVILLGSSLSSDYDVSAALSHIEDGIWVYHSKGDQVLLGPVRTLGTIDGKMGIDGAGLVGLHPKGIPTDHIHNIAWSTRYERWGWTGAHTDATSEPFVRTVLATHIVQTRPSGTQPAAATVDAYEPADDPAHARADARHPR